jgi:hypothetical protein
MSELRIAVKQDRVAFQRGEDLVGAAYWKLDLPAQALEVRLFWFTRGKGTEDASVVQTVRFDEPMPEEARPFRFTLPASPYSFSGKLISLIWALELVTEPAKEVQRLEITIAPGGQEVLLGSAPEDVARKKSFFAPRVQ